MTATGWIIVILIVIVVLLARIESLLRAWWIEWRER